MYHRKIIDDIKVKRLWWLDEKHRKFHRKNRKKCSCWMCSYRKQGNSKNTLPPKEQSKLDITYDEIEEFQKDLSLIAYTEDMADEMNQLLDGVEID